MPDPLKDSRDRKLRQARGVALLMEQTCRQVYENRHPQALHAVQWSALRYFSRAGEQARNVAGLAKYLGVTSGPASRTAASLVKRELINSSPSPEDSRSRLFALTGAGEQVLLSDPINRAAETLNGLSDSELATLVAALDKIYAGLGPSDED